MGKNRIIAALLALFLGHWGVHKFYLEKNNAGVVYICLSFIGISFVLGFIDFVILVSMSDQDFDEKYNYSTLPNSGRSYTLPQNSNRSYAFTPPVVNHNSEDKIKTLVGLKELHDQGIITAEEYEEKRKTFLDSLSNTPQEKYKHKKKEKVDINSCSKNDIVHKLGLPIVYAHEIEEFKKEGFIFTDIDELENLIGIPQYYLQKIEPLIIFSYDYKKEAEYSWRKLNILSVEELMTYEISANHAEKIVEERHNNGKYQSLLDVSKRTGIPLEIYRHLV